jgi:DedD protein
MEDEGRRGKEYYQVNLDAGRIFWIAFIIGVVLIAIFVFGFLVGGGEDRSLFQISSRNLRERFQDRTQAETKDSAGAEREPVEQEPTAGSGENAGRDNRLEELFDTDLEGETRYIEVESLEEAVAESEQKRLLEELRQPEEETAREPIEPAPAPAPAPERKTMPAVSGGNYYIQVASFTKEENARAFADKLRKNLYKVEIEKAVVNGTTFHRVRVGPFDRKSVAANTMASMKRRFDLKDPFVVAKRS